MQHERPGRPKQRARAAPLRQYRLYFLHGLDRLISYSHEFEAEDDAAAVRISEAWREGRRAELWCGPRRLKGWDSDG